MNLFVGIPFGMVAAAVCSQVDAVDHFSHFDWFLVLINVTNKGLHRLQWSFDFVVCTLVILYLLSFVYCAVCSACLLLSLLVQRTTKEKTPLAPTLRRAK